MNTRTIQLKPGEKLIIEALHVPPPPPIQDQDGRHVLPVPYLSQNSPTARRSPGDCGPACIAMAIHYLTDQEPTVDQVAQACGQFPDSRWSNFAQLAKGARAYGVTATWTNPVNAEIIVEQILAGLPILVLINYGKDPDRISGDFGEFREITWQVFLSALETTHELPSNDHSNHGMTFNG